MGWQQAARFGNEIWGLGPRRRRPLDGRKRRRDAGREEEEKGRRTGGGSLGVGGAARRGLGDGGETRFVPVRRWRLGFDEVLVFLKQV